MEDNNIQDNSNVNANTQVTPDAFGAPDATSNTENEVSIDDIILGNVDETATAFTESVPEGNENAPLEQPQDVPTENKNDENRYEYWQSRSSKLEQELEQVKNQTQQIAAQQQQMQQPAPEPEAEPQQFPPAPAKPAMPRTFSREEANADSQSESARYLEDLDNWRDNMTEYTALKGQYDMAVVQEQLDGERNYRQRIEAAQRQEYESQQKKSEIGHQVMQQYGMSEPEAVDFINEMSSTESLTMDNLVQLYRMRKGGGNAPNPTPSQGFQQAQRAQQVPSPMGVQPATSTQNAGGVEDQIMDSMIGDLNSKNPWT